jgi:TRAP-type C4-dicarboxylate transport system permease large subunit
VLIDTVKATGTTSIMIGAATCISYIVAKEQLAVTVANWITEFTDNKYVFLLIVIFRS